MARHAYSATAIHVLLEAFEHEPDFAGFVAQVLSETAAAVGGAEVLLAKRPGSWEAEHVRALIEGTPSWSGLESDGDAYLARTINQKGPQ